MAALFSILMMQLFLPRSPWNMSRMPAGCVLQKSGSMIDFQTYGAWCSFFVGCACFPRMAASWLPQFPPLMAVLSFPSSQNFSNPRKIISLPLRVPLKNFLPLLLKKILSFFQPKSLLPFSSSSQKIFLCSRKKISPRLWISKKNPSSSPLNKIKIFHFPIWQPWRISLGRWTVRLHPGKSLSSFSI